LVSIGMPIFNCEKTLNSAINSVLNQTYSNWELILIDDGSKDRTLSVAKSFNDSRIKVISDGLNLKLPHRLNQIIAISKGKYFARMDGDDVSYPDRLQTQVEYLENYPNVDILGTQILIFDDDGNPRGKSALTQSHQEICCRPWAGFSLAHPTWMGKLEWFSAHKYREEAIRMEDYELLLRTYKTSRFACLPQILLGYRVASLSLKNNLTARYNIAIALLEKTFVDRDYLFAFGVFEQVAKAIVDILAISTGLNFKILRHRTGIALDEAELNRWKQIWAKCNSDIHV
ncbi:MAG TPA: glycosyltransferase family 2 protein, partial [Leptolyngbyaceae cyanobacterium]